MEIITTGSLQNSLAKNARSLVPFNTSVRSLLISDEYICKEN